MFQNPSYLGFPPHQSQYLAARDPKLGEYINNLPIPRRHCHPDVFPALIRTMVGQQVSAAAQEKIWGRLAAAITPFTPENVALAPAELLRGCGVSRQKAHNMQAAAREFASGKFADLASSPDAVIMARLKGLSGVGNWTAEMMLIFTFRRQNVMSYGDLAIKRGLCRVHGYAEISEELFQSYRELYSPYGTLASIYLWEIAGLPAANLL